MSEVKLRKLLEDTFGKGRFEMMARPALPYHECNTADGYIQQKEDEWILEVPRLLTEVC